MKANNWIHCGLESVHWHWMPSQSMRTICFTKSNNNNNFTNTLTQCLHMCANFNANFSCDGLGSKLSITGTDVFCPLENIQQEYHFLLNHRSILSWLSIIIWNRKCKINTKAVFIISIKRTVILSMIWFGSMKTAFYQDYININEASSGFALFSIYPHWLTHGLRKTIANEIVFLFWWFQPSTNAAPAVRNNYKILQIHQELDH